MMSSSVTYTNYSEEIPTSSHRDGVFDYRFEDDEDYSSDGGEDYSIQDFQDGEIDLDDEPILHEEKEDTLFREFEEEENRQLGILDGSIPYHQMTHNEQFIFLDNLKPKHMKWDEFYKKNPMYAPCHYKTNVPTKPTDEDWELLAQEIDDIEQQKIDYKNKIEQREKDRIIREQQQQQEKLRNQRIFRQQCCDYLEQHNIVYDNNNWFELYCHHKDKEREKDKKEKLKIMIKEAEKASKECDENLRKLEIKRRKINYQKKLKRERGMNKQKTSTKSKFKEVSNPDQKKKEKELKKAKKEREIQKWREKCNKAQEERKRKEKETNGIIQVDYEIDNHDDTDEIDENEIEKEQSYEQESLKRTTHLIHRALRNKEEREKLEKLKKQEMEIKKKKEREEKEREEKTWSSVVSSKKKKSKNKQIKENKVNKQRQTKLDLLQFAVHAKKTEEIKLKEECKRKGMAFVENMKTRVCKSIKSNTPCRHGHRCRFAHRPSELRFNQCRFGERCRHGARCFNKHSNETIEAYYLRLGFPRCSLQL